MKTLEKGITIAILSLSDGNEFVTNTIGYDDEFHFAETHLGNTLLGGATIKAIEFSDL